MNRSLIIVMVLLLALAIVVSANAAPNDDPEKRAALIALYNSTDGPNWHRNDGWGSPSSYCAWYRVICNDSFDVMRLALPDNNLNGPLSSEIGNLVNLYYLDLDGNQLSSCIPSQLGNLSNLTELRLDRNLLSGLIRPN